MWKILKTTEIFKHSRITLLEDDVQLPNGTESKYLKFGNISNGCDVVAINEDGKILLQKEYNHPIGKDMWQFPGGHNSFDESTEESARRELKEESGYEAEELEFIGYHHIYRRRSSEESHIFVATGLKYTGTNQESSEKGMEHHWFEPEEIETMIKNDEITAVDVLAIWLLFKLNYNKS